MKVTFVRHGQTEHNTDRIINGQSQDEGVDDIGRIQAAEAAEKLRDKGFDLIFSSPLLRARETAEIINKTLQLPIYYRGDLKERSWGSLEGKDWSEIEKETGLGYEQDQKLLEIDASPWGGEGIEDMRERVRRFISKVKEKHADKHSLVVTHSWVIEEMHFLYNLKFEGVGNCSIHEFEV